MLNAECVVSGSGRTCSGPIYRSARRHTSTRRRRSASVGASQDRRWQGQALARTGLRGYQSLDNKCLPAWSRDNAARVLRRALQMPRPLGPGRLAEEQLPHGQLVRLMPGAAARADARAELDCGASQHWPWVLRIAIRAVSRCASHCHGANWQGASLFLRRLAFAPARAWFLALWAVLRGMV